MRPFPVVHDYITISDMLNLIFSEYGIKHNIFSITSDNASNMIKAFSRLKSKYKKEGIDIIHIRCFAHVLHLVVKEFLKNELVSNVLKRLRNLFKKIKRKTLKNMLKAFCVVNKEPELCVQLDVKTRWNSTYDMIAVALRTRMSLMDLVSKPENELSGFSFDEKEWNTLLHLKDILEPFKKATLDLCGDNITASQLFPIMDHLNKHLRKSLNKREYIPYKSAFDSMIKKFDKYWKELEEFALYAHILDPRFKLSLIERSKKFSVKENLRFKLDQTNESGASGLIDEQLDDVNQDLLTKEFSLIETLLHQNDMLASDENEIEKYFSCQVVGFQVDPIEWWKTNSKDFPNLSSMGLEYMAAVPTSVASERIFSIGGLTVTKLRNRLTPLRVNKLMSLWSWNRFLVDSNIS